jgi:hypothetical protein
MNTESMRTKPIREIFTGSTDHRGRRYFITGCPCHACTCAAEWFRSLVKSSAGPAEVPSPPERLP